ncbi:MAG TPA: response regulator [Trueperaceae bacterium]|nr:response regulator [Trueperaceae bacterium]
MPSWTILLADPDPLQRQLVDMLLSQEDFHIVTAGNGRDTLEFLKEHTPNLAILATELPDVGGDAICRKLKAVKRLSKVPVILTTNPPGKGGLTSDLRQLARAVGADLLLQKPLGDKGLRDKVNQLLRRSQGKAPATPTPDATKNTVIIEQALEELSQAGDDDTATPDAVSEALYRENEELRNEVAALKRRLVRLEAGLLARRDGVARPATFIPGAAPAAPAMADAGAPEPSPAHAPAPAATEDPLPDALPAEASREELQHRVTELERRNRALIAALEDAKAQDDAPRRLFGRRRR